MKVVLLSDVRKIGKKGNVVDVAEGYARNYLIPERLAHFADELTLKTIADQKRQSEKKVGLEIQQMRAIAGRLAGKVLDFFVPAASSGKLYAALKDSEILARIKRLEPGLPNRVEIQDFESIKTTGEHTVKVKFSNLEISIKIFVMVKG